MAAIQSVRKEEKQVVEAAKVDAIIKQAQNQFSDDIINQSIAIVQRNERLDVDDDVDQMLHLPVPYLGLQQPNQGFGQSNHGFQQPNQVFGQPNQGFGQSNHGFQQPNQGFGQSNQPNLDFGQSCHGFQLSNHGFQQRGKAKPKPKPKPKPQQKQNITVVSGTLKNQSKRPMRVVDTKKWAGYTVMDFPNPLNSGSMAAFAQSGLSSKGVKAAVVYAGTNSAGDECAWLLAWSDSKSAGTRVYADCGPRSKFDKVNWKEVERRLASASRSVGQCSDKATGISVYATLVASTGKDTQEACIKQICLLPFAVGEGGLGVGC